jgi:hypothetical protein
MPDLLTNRLLFLSNAKYILELLRTPVSKDAALFSLNAVKPMPESLAMPLTRFIRPLALVNMAPLQFAPEVDKVAMQRIFRGKPGKQPPPAIDELIESMRNKLTAGGSGGIPKKEVGTADKTDLELFESAVANFRQHHFFCHYDWRWTNWNTVEDVHSVAPATFELPTTAIEFTTRWTPPIAAMEALAQIFPSVRFELSFRYRRRDPWTTVEIFPLTPFGY